MFKIHYLASSYQLLDDVANALVSNKLDYCNSLFYNLPNTSIDRLQLVQNSLARFVFPSVRRCHHISPILAKLHWLPIQQRIVFQSELQSDHQSDHLRSPNANLLVVPNINNAIGRRSFSYAVPTVWNLLSLSI